MVWHYLFVKRYLFVIEKFHRKVVSFDFRRSRAHRGKVYRISNLSSAESRVPSFDIYDPLLSTRLAFTGTKKGTRVKAEPKNLVSPSTESLLVVVGAIPHPRQKLHSRALSRVVIECSESFSFLACELVKQQSRIDITCTQETESDSIRSNLYANGGPYFQRLFLKT